MKKMTRCIQMKITVIYGQNHKGSTYHIAHDLDLKLNGEKQNASG